MSKNMTAAISIVAVLVAIIVGWHLWGVHQRKPPLRTDTAITTMDFDSFQNALAERVRARFNVPPGSIVVADVPYDIGTLLDPVQTYPSDDSDCLPKPLPQLRPALNLFPSYQLSSQTAAQITLGSNALQNLTSAGLNLTHNTSLNYSIDQVSVQLMDMKTLGQLTAAGDCGSYVAQHPGVRLIRGVVMGRISFTMKADNAGSVQAKLKDLGGGSISTNPDASTVTVADEESTQILQMLAVIEAPAQQASGGEPHRSAPGRGPASVAPIPPPVIRESQTSQVVAPPPGSSVARVFLQQDAADPPDFGKKFAQALQSDWPNAQVVQQVEKIASAKMPGGPQVRFFNAADADLASKCRDHLKSIGLDARIVRIGLTAPKGQLEVWLPKEGYPATQRNNPLPQSTLPAPAVSTTDDPKKAMNRPRQIAQVKPKANAVDPTQQSATAQSPSVTINSDNNRGNIAGINYGTQNTYNAKRPLPNMSRIYTTPIPAEPADFNVGQPAKNAGLEISFSLDAPFTDPFFWVHCDNPCRPSQIKFGHGGQAWGGWANGAPFVKTGDPSVVGVGGGSKKAVYPNEIVIITVRALDERRPLQRIISVVPDEQ